MKPTLRYFEGRGRAEPVRLLFAEQGVQYEDARVPEANWAAMKSTTPFGQLPVLEVDGVQIAQSSAILRFAARKYGLAPLCEAYFTMADMLTEAAEDVLNNVVYKIMSDQTPSDAKAKTKTEDVPHWLGYFARMLGDQPFFVRELSFADLAVFCSLYELNLVVCKYASV